MFNIMRKIKPETLAQLVQHLNENKQRLEQDTSSYARGRKSYWLQEKWRLDKKCFEPATKDERLWKYCKATFPEADLGLVVYGDVGIKVHRDDSYADWRGVGLNLGELKGWYYDNQYPAFSWSKQTNQSNPIVHRIEAGDVFEFNTKNPHAAIQPSPERWAIFLWKKKN